MNIRVKFEPRDLWIGVYWKTYNEGWSKMLNVYICILPMLPICLTFEMESYLRK